MTSRNGHCVSVPAPRLHGGQGGLPLIDSVHLNLPPEKFGAVDEAVDTASKKHSKWPPLSPDVAGAARGVCACSCYSEKNQTKSALVEWGCASSPPAVSFPHSATMQTS